MRTIGFIVAIVTAVAATAQTPPACNPQFGVNLNSAFLNCADLRLDTGALFTDTIRQADGNSFFQTTQIYQAFWKDTPVTKMVPAGNSVCFLVGMKVLGDEAFCTVGISGKDWVVTASGFSYCFGSCLTWGKPPATAPPPQ